MRALYFLFKLYINNTYPLIIVSVIISIFAYYVILLSISCALLSYNISWLLSSLISILGFLITVFSILIALSNLGRVTLIKKNAPNVWSNIFQQMLNTIGALSVNIVIMYIISVNIYTHFVSAYNIIGNYYIMVSSLLILYKILYFLKNMIMLAAHDD